MHVEGVGAAAPCANGPYFPCLAASITATSIFFLRAAYLQKISLIERCNLKFLAQNFSSRDVFNLKHVYCQESLYEKYFF